MFCKCPRNFSQGPAIEMWSVVHLPSVLIRSGISVRSFPSHGANGASFWSRLLSGAMTTSTLAFSSLGAMNPLSSTAKPLGGKVKPVGASSITLLPSLSSKVSVAGLKSRRPAMVRATVSSGLPMKANVLGLPSARRRKFRLKEVTMAFLRVLSSV